MKPERRRLELSRPLGDVTRTWNVFGYSRDSVSRFKKLYEEEAESVLREIVRLTQPNTGNQLDPEIESRVGNIALDNPAAGQQKISNELHKEGGGDLFLREAAGAFGSGTILRPFKTASKPWKSSCAGRVHSNRISAPGLGKNQKKKNRRLERLHRNIPVTCLTCFDGSRIGRLLQPETSGI